MFSKLLMQVLLQMRVLICLKIKYQNCMTITMYYVIETLMYYLNNYCNFVTKLKHIFYEFCFKL